MEHCIVRFVKPTVACERAMLWVFNAAICALLLATSAYAQLSHKLDTLLNDSFDGIGGGPNSDSDAARFLAQSTFGPTLTDIQHLRQIGYNAWLAEQFTAPASHELSYLQWVATLPAGQNTVDQRERFSAWLINALGTPDPSNNHVAPSDQLRQRVAFALSEIFVVSDRNGALYQQPFSLASYYDLLADDAFGNYRQLLTDVTLHPAMGTYLSMLGNQKLDPIKNTLPDENYAREVLQLFSIGLFMLSTDGSIILSNGHPVATYDQSVVSAFARVFTGWNFRDTGDDPSCSANYDFCYPFNAGRPAWRLPMQAVEAYHDTAAKNLLVYSGVANGGVLPPNASAQSDLDAALDIVFNHPNVGPFIGKQLIQRLVTSNPSPAYVQRVAQAFNNNGLGIRGDLRSVVSAILLDPEARYGQWRSPDTFGKLREPMLKLTHMWRVMGAYSTNGRFDMSIADPAAEYGEMPLRAPSVFNFFRPDFQQPGEVSNLGLVSPEFQIVTPILITSAPNDIQMRIFEFYAGNPYSYANLPASIVMDETSGLAANPEQLLNRFSLLFLSQQMSPFMHQTLIDQLNATPNNNGGRDRVGQTLYLILTSPEYSVQK